MSISKIKKNELKVEVILNYGPRISSPRSKTWHLAHCYCPKCVNPKINFQDHFELLKTFVCNPNINKSPQGIRVTDFDGLRKLCSKLIDKGISYTFTNYIEKYNYSPREETPKQIEERFKFL